VVILYRVAPGTQTVEEALEDGSVAYGGTSRDSALAVDLDMEYLEKLTVLYHLIVIC
jgi:hypothetical protein